MVPRPTMLRPQSICVTMLGLLAGLSAFSGEAADPPTSPNQANPDAVTPVKKVTVTQSDDKFTPGNLKFKAEIDLKQVVLPRGPKTGEELVLTGNNLTRVVKLERAQLENWQQKYLTDVEKAAKDKKSLIMSKGREIFRFPAVAPTKKPVAVVAGQEQEIVAFQGLPELDIKEEDLIINNCIMINHLKVVNDPGRTTGEGHWTFGYLMSEMANQAETNLSPSKFVRDWLRHWEVDQSINGFTAKNRAATIKQLIIDPWPKLKSGEVDLTKAPFRLLAIGSRLDLRSNKVLGFERIGGGGAGEARFVFCAVNLNDKDGDGNPKPLPFTVIFEYAIKRGDYTAVRDWALQWYRLKDYELGSAKYNEELQKITDQFTGASADQESPPNRSALGQLRTNEIALDNPWELREFRIDAHNTGELKQVTVKQNPDNNTFNGFGDGKTPGPKAADLAKFINANEVDITNQRHRAPVDFPTGQDFLGAAAPTPQNVFWKAPGIRDPDARHLFSLGTCTACHGREAFPSVGPETGQDFDNVADPALANRQPPHFTHVRPRLADKKAQFSAFLTGKNPKGQPYMLDDPNGQIDPATTKVKVRPFGDLPFRAADLKGIVEYGSHYELFRRPLQKVH